VRGSGLPGEVHDQEHRTSRRPAAPHHREEIHHAQVSDHNRRYLQTAFELHDRVSDAIAADPPPAPPPPRPRPAPASSRHPNELILRVLHAMSTDERVLIRLHDDTQHAGQITRRTREGLVLDTGQQIPVPDVCAITAAPPPTTTTRHA
jgi:hypothetical protein